MLRSPVRLRLPTCRCRAHKRCRTLPTRSTPKCTRRRPPRCSSLCWPGTCSPTRTLRPCLTCWQRLGRTCSRGHFQRQFYKCPPRKHCRTHPPQSIRRCTRRRPLRHSAPSWSGRCSPTRTSTQHLQWLPPRDSCCNSRRLPDSS